MILIFATALSYLWDVVASGDATQDQHNLQVATSGPLLRLIALAFSAGLTALFAVAATAQASIEISTAPTQNMSCSAGVCTPTAKSAVLNVNDLTAMLSSTDITVKSGNSAVTIGIVSPFAWASTHRLTLDAQLNVNIKAQVMVEGTAGLTIVTNDGGTGGDLMFYPGGKIDFWDTNSSLFINGNSYVLVSSLETLAKDIHANLQGFYALANDDDASGNKYGHSPIHRFKGTWEGLGNSISNLSIQATKSKSLGLIAQNLGVVRDLSLENASVEGSQLTRYAGALIGYNDYGVVLDCSSSGQVSAPNGYAGGLVGHTYTSRILRSRANVTVEGDFAGGLVGLSGRESVVSQSFATGAVSASQYAGGLVGINYITGISDSYATGAVSDAADGNGGLTGEECCSKTTSSYAIGTVRAPNNAGGVFGYVTSESPSGDYWDLDTSGTQNGCGFTYFADCSGITGLTDAQLKSGLPAGFDPKIWAHSSSINNGYPYLIANPPPN